jgi:cellulose biosynthesis protein BcsQ
MYVVTFYSYKGGVGRTMALGNVAYLLAASGKRVLAVDFDLEAPGLSSYGPFRCAGEHPGIVEYVLEYMDSNVAPVVSNYIVECRAGDYPVWLMPAGRHTEAGYAARYSSINWQELYAERDGFLLFEDIRQQWASYGEAGFDYVLIDSRTGHTDIGGICTRQLPDAVVIQFLPTPQNIEGLQPIVQGIRKEGAPVRRDGVQLLFCPSNLPDLDDQELILRGLLEKAQRELKYAHSSAEIRHYGALDLLQQPLYAMSNPLARLAKEYEALRKAIVSHNPEDREGALIALDRMRNDFQSALRANEKVSEERIRGDAALIAARFPQDAEVAWRLAALANAMTRPDDELAALNVILEGSPANVALALLRRARTLATLDDQPGAVDDLTRLLTCESATNFEVSPASDLLRRLRPGGWTEVFETAVLNEKLDGGARAQLLLALMGERLAVPSALTLAKKASQASGRDDAALRNGVTLALIADGRFEEAMVHISPVRHQLLTSNFLPDIFNYAVAEWGATAQIPEDLFGRVLEMGTGRGRHSDANNLQCFALARYVLGQREQALEDIKLALLAARRVNLAFSCWRYLGLNAAEMQDDLDAMHDLFAREVALNPPGRDGLKGANSGR